MISGRYWILTILNEPIHGFTSRPNSHIDEFQSTVLSGAELKGSIHQKKFQQMNNGKANHLIIQTSSSDAMEEDFICSHFD